MSLYRHLPLLSLHARAYAYIRACMYICIFFKKNTQVLRVFSRLSAAVCTRLARIVETSAFARAHTTPRRKNRVAVERCRFRVLLSEGRVPNNRAMRGVPSETRWDLWCCPFFGIGAFYSDVDFLSLHFCVEIAAYVLYLIECGIYFRTRFILSLRHILFKVQRLNIYKIVRYRLDNVAK